ncbi:hypothetical protein N7481_001492 [Penicillium waksmanii]|uniref:uncharacterized protein n=1 Tax=Penicillium waksmanii TaxID=69791 RepID=UPI002546CBE7|nr:uncharacterized protein N7481_001492 [Penicillium waksmanii]KAJ6001083.1 hypothetical protein N7481_001492 [Penicillium waksmanii]
MNITLVGGYPDKRVNPSRLAALILHKGVFLYPMDNRLRMSVAMTITDELFLMGISIIKESLNEILECDEISSAQSEDSKSVTPWETLD